MSEPFFVQYSSGSTGHPRGCILTGGAIAWQLEALATYLRVDVEREIDVIWLPLAHDMGVFGCLLLAYWVGHRLILGTPDRFLRSPYSWIEDCSAFGATISATPSFGLDLAGRVARRVPERPIPMTRMVIGGDRIRPATLRAACQALGSARLPDTAVVPAYGLAEAVLAVSMADVGVGPRFLKVGPDLDTGTAPRGVTALPDGELTSAGSPLPGCEVTIDSADGIGEIIVTSPALATGYLNDPDATRAKFGRSGLRTGDLGFLVDGELYVIGRADDLLDVAGRNVYAKDLEDAMVTVSDVRPGNCAVVDVESSQGVRLVALAERVADHRDPYVIAQDLSSQMLAAAGIRVGEFMFLPRRTFPKTPSGKTQRFRCREIAQSSVPEAIRVTAATTR